MSAHETDATAAKDFLAAVMSGWHSVCSASRTGGFRTDGFHDNAGELYDKAVQLTGADRNVWFGIHPLVEIPDNGRGGEHDVAQVRVLQVDLDWFDEAAHADTSLPAEHDLRSAVSKLQHQPSYVIETGHGLQVYWLLRSPVDPERGRALIQRMHAMLRHAGLSPERADLASIMRVPGTMNRKPGCGPVPVRVAVARPELQYTPENLEKHLSLVPDESQTKRARGASGGGWRSLTDEDRCGLHSLTTAALERLEEAGWHSPTLHHAASGEPYVGVTRPGKTEGSQSATIGFVGPGVLHVFTENAPGLQANRNYAWEAASSTWVEPGGANEAKQLAPACAPDGKPYTDTGNAQRLIERHGEHLRYVPAWGQWMVYRSGKWHHDDDDVLVSGWAREIGNELMSPENLAAVRDADAAFRAHVNWYKRTQNAIGMRDTVRVARTLPEVRLDHEDLDAQRHLFNVRNGTIDLTTGKWREHRPEDLLCHMSPVDFVADVQAPKFTKFLDRIQPDPEVRAFLQRLFGMAMLGATEEHVLPIALGEGANGKSTLTRIIASVFGDYAVVASRDLLLAVKRDVHPTLKATLFRRRLAHSGELNPDALLDEAQVKELTGGDRVKARRMRQDEWEFDPTHTFWLHANHRPRIVGTDDGIWRRVLLIPFEVQVPAEEQDPGIADRIVSSELSGVLNWLLEGLAEYQRRGLAPPAAVLGATRQYRAESDTVEQFLSQAGIEVEQGAKTIARVLKDRHEEWFDTSGITGSEPVHYQLVAERLRKLGCSQMNARGGRYWKGVRVSEASWG